MANRLSLPLVWTISSAIQTIAFEGRGWVGSLVAFQPLFLFSWWWNCGFHITLVWFCY